VASEAERNNGQDPGPTFVLNRILYL